MPSPLLLPWAAIDDVLFDMDGTLLDLAFDNYFWQQLLPERYAAMHGLSEAAARAVLQPMFDGSRGSLDWYCLEFWSQRTGLDIAGLKREVAGRVRLLPETTQVLDALRRQGKRLWLVTNAHPQTLEMKLQRAAIADYFSCIVSSHALHAAKEEPAFWHRLAARHPFDPARTLFVDDSLPVLQAARKHGLAHVVAVRWPDRSRPPHAVADFPAVLTLEDLLVAPTAS